MNRLYISLIALCALVAAPCLGMNYDSTDTLTITDVNGRSKVFSNTFLRKCSSTIDRYCKDQENESEIDYSKLSVKENAEFMTIDNFDYLDELLTRIVEAAQESAASQVSIEGKPLSDASCPVCYKQCSCSYHKDTHALRDAYAVINQDKGTKRYVRIPEIFRLADYLEINMPAMGAIAYHCYDYLATQRVPSSVEQSEKINAFYQQLRDRCLNYIPCYGSVMDFLKALSEEDQKQLIASFGPHPKWFADGSIINVMNIDLSSRYLESQGIFCKIVNFDDLSTFLKGFTITRETTALFGSETRQVHHTLEELVAAHRTTINVSGHALSRLSNAYPRCNAFIARENRITTIDPTITSKYRELDLSYNYLSGVNVPTRMCDNYQLDISNNYLAWADKRTISHDFALKTNAPSAVKRLTVGALNATKYLWSVGAGFALSGASNYLIDKAGQWLQPYANEVGSLSVVKPVMKPVVRYCCASVVKQAVNTAALGSASGLPMCLLMAWNGYYRNWQKAEQARPTLKV